jgi:iron complex transport system substrate-binding protein
MIEGVMPLSRRSLLAAIPAVPLPHGTGRAATMTDGAGRAVTVPAQVFHVFPAGPPAAITPNTLAPRLLPGWPRHNGTAERAFLPDVGARPT